MNSDGQKPQGAVPRSGRSNGIIPTSFRSLSSYLRIVSSGASTVASTVRSAASAASAIVDRDNHASLDQVLWAGYDKLECEEGTNRQVLLLGYRRGFQVWDIEESDNVHCLVSRHDGPISCLQMLPKPLLSKGSEDKFSDSRPLLIICSDGSSSNASCNGNIQKSRDRVGGDFVPTVVWFYSLKTQSFVHEIKFRSVVYLVRCSARVVAVLQAAQVHCFDAGTLERKYSVLTNPVVAVCSGSGGIGFGPLAVGPRWIAYSGSLTTISNPVSVTRQHLTSANSHSPTTDNVGMVIVRDIVSRLVIAQFKAHKSPISSLCFDPSGTLLVTASVQGHNINVFRIMPGFSDTGPHCVHLYRLQRGFTNAVIQDIGFSNDGQWIIISSGRGTSHLFDISPSNGSDNLQSPITLSVVSRIRSGNNGWKNTVSGRISSISGAFASVFHNFKENDSKTRYNLLVFSPPGCIVQYALHLPCGEEEEDSTASLSGLSISSAPDNDAKLVVEPIKKWNVFQKQNRVEEEDNFDIYGENGNSDISSRIYPERTETINGDYPKAKPMNAKGKNGHIYISEAEFRVQQAKIPLWAKPEICFHAMIKSMKMDEEEEMEIERVPTRMIEVRARDIIPVFDRFQSSNFHQTSSGMPHEMSENGIESSPR